MGGHGGLTNMDRLDSLMGGMRIIFELYFAVLFFSGGMQGLNWFMAR
jgi:hypothetical protein